MKQSKEIALTSNGQPERRFVTALPTIEDLYAMNVPESDDVNTLNVLLDKPPLAAWVKQHPYIKKDIQTEQGTVKVGIDYLPIGRVEWLLKRVFKRYRIEVLREGTMFNGVYCTVRIHYWHPILGAWEYHDGVGAQQLQTKQGSSPADMANINQGAISMALGIAKTLAIKDACDHFGRLFGSDLNRNETATLPDVPRLSREEARLVDLINLCTSTDQLEGLRGQVDLHENVQPYFQSKLEELNGKAI